MNSFKVVLTGFLIMAWVCSIPSQTHRDFSLVDKHAGKVPKKERKTIEQLTAYLVEPFENDFDKIRSIYHWIGENIKYDHKGLKSDDLAYNYNVGLVFEKGSAVCTGYSKLFSYMTNLAGIISLPVSGYSKNSLTSVVNAKTPDHVWNAVRVKGKWYLLDVTWDVGLSKRKQSGKEDLFNTYFLAQPLEFLQDHMPAIPMWQLIEHPYTLDQFLQNEIPLHDTSKVDSTFSYKEAIQEFYEFSDSRKRLYEYRETFRFNPTKENGNAMAHGLIDYAGILSDSLNTAMEAEIEKTELLKISNQILTLCKEAEQYIPFYDWQKRLYASSLMSNSVIRFNEEIRKEEPDELIFDELMEGLNKAQELIHDMPDNLWRQGLTADCGRLQKVISKKLAKRN